MLNFILGAWAGGALATGLCAHSEFVDEGMFSGRASEWLALVATACAWPALALSLLRGDDK